MDQRKRVETQSARGGSVLRGLLIIGGLIGSCIVLGLLVVVVQAAANDGAFEAAPPPRVAEPETPAQELAARLQGFESQYAQAANEIQKGQVFRNARAFEVQFFAKSSRELVDWRARVDEDSIRTVFKGGGAITLTLRPRSPDGAFMLKFRNAGSWIDDKNPVYAQVAGLKVGDCVLFSGAVDPKETSLSESGAMSDPEYTVVFKAVRRCP